MKLAIVPGSFDPVTNGHLDLARRAAGLFDRVIVVVMDNAEKQYLFSREERFALVQQAVRELPGVEADMWAGMLWEYARDKKACAIVKGVRSAQDLGYEILQARFNEEKWPGAQTVLLPPAPGMEELSSTELKRRAALGLVRLRKHNFPITSDGFGRLTVSGSGSFSGPSRQPGADFRTNL